MSDKELISRLYGGLLKHPKIYSRHTTLNTLIQAKTPDICPTGVRIYNHTKSQAHNAHAHCRQPQIQQHEQPRSDTQHADAQTDTHRYVGTRTPAPTSPMHAPIRTCPLSPRSRAALPAAPRGAPSLWLLLQAPDALPRWCPACPAKSPHVPLYPPVSQ